MTITRQDIKILKSANISDFEDGGGRVTANQVRDGESNDLFLDVPDTSRAYGDVDMVKIYPAVTTQTDEPFLGSVFSLGRLPEDDSVNITLFTTKDWFDTRKDAIQTLESYLAPSVKLDGELLDVQLKGQKVIQLIMNLTSELPTIGKSLYIVQNVGQPNAFEQYVFVTSVSAQERSFRVGSSLQNYKVATLELSTKLDYSFEGITPSQFSSSIAAPASVRDTRVADTASYYTTKPLLESVSMGSASVKVDDIFTQLVPSARQDKPLSGLNPAGVSQAVAPVGIETTIVLPSFTISSVVTYNIGMPVTPTTLKVSLGATEFKEDGGALTLGGVTIGFIDYGLGIISWMPNYKPSSDTLTITYLPAVVVPTINDSLALEVTESTRGLSLAWTLDTVPMAGSLVVTYVVLGDIYTLRDLGGGVLKGANDSFGVGRVNYETGDVLLTFGSEPDVSSHILLTWANMNGISRLPSTTSPKLGFRHTIPPATAGRSINLPSMVITWGSKTATISNRQVVGDATGTFNPESGLLVVEPNVLPPVGQAYSIAYKQLPKFNIGWGGVASVPLAKEPSQYHADDALVLKFMVDVSNPELLKGTFRFKFKAKLVQNVPFKAQMGVKDFEVYEGSGSDVGKIYYDGGLSDYDEYNNPTHLPPTLVGAINYSTGLVTITVSAIRYTWWEQTYDYNVLSYGAARYTSK